ncbi:hypothetical protein QNI19_29290 [Cytophagaceae bacterium DM2B3-1]|uniref:Chemotaxis protein CheX n=1 Tax=Xanthocytophaga flava TaxID=3048013 RepID=A0ABT7CTG5_9BACT|nr:hypothetical protein [Xanthocytophaga flavus]MDJ1467941.1 hypothetical protein [Xanthocytophaga flavus]MDJ1497068.1 hypothetical protein [Xanthocytophaga flavus]
MTNVFNDYDVAAVRDLMNGALLQAADAFSKMVNDTLEVKEVNLTCTQPVDLFAHYTEAFLLTTEVKGEIQGKSYLLLDNEEAQVAIAKMRVNDPFNADELTIFQKSALLELDNVLSAAALTWVANRLNIFCYGDVPHLQKLTHTEIQSFFKAEADSSSWIIQSKLYSHKDQTSPSFIWLFEPDMIYAIKKSTK